MAILQRKSLDKFRS